VYTVKKLGKYFVKECEGGKKRKGAATRKGDKKVKNVR
jgi:hypothetical protein